jgi:hypothetical protein
MKKYAALAAGVAIVALGLLMFLAPSAYEVVDKGKDVRPYESGVVYKIKVADTVTVYAAEESQPDMDHISGSALVALATASLIAALLLGAKGGPSRLRTFYSLAAAGLGYLAFDEFFAVHETVGHNLPFLSDLPGIERPDDLIISLYLIPALAFLYYFRDVFTSSSRAVKFFAAAIAGFVLSGLSDIAGMSVDEPLEVITAAMIVGGFISLLVTHLAGLGDYASPDSAAAPPAAPESPALSR